MTMVICNACKAQTSTLAAACHCGATQRKTTHYASVAIGSSG